ncbi:hypothetical protein LIER_28089 [Lithospermum erythrorhizon]|uniref:Mitochondrial protein n=1 Tax=Lithospermum erythrorhizon TaxID=34254 RepID=A0AAV3RKF2_LITER
MLKQYMIDLLTKANMLHCKLASTLMSTSASDDTSSVQDTSSTSPLDPTLYRQLVGSLQYLTLTLLDLSYAVYRVCQHMHAPTMEHFVLVKRIIHYVKYTLELGLVITPSPDFTIQAFSDADWAGPRRNERWPGLLLNLTIRLLSIAPMARKELQVQFISTKDQIDDILTKPLSTSRFVFFRTKLRLCLRVPSAFEGSIG